MEYLARIVEFADEREMTFPELNDFCVTAFSNEDLEKVGAEALGEYLTEDLLEGPAKAPPLPNSQQPGLNEIRIQAPVAVEARVLLRRARLEKGWTQVELAKRLGMSIKDAPRIEDARPSARVPPELLSQAADLLGIELPSLPEKKTKTKRAPRKVSAPMDAKLLQLLKDAREMLAQMSDFIAEHEGQAFDWCPSCSGGARIEGQLCVKCRLDQVLADAESPSKAAG